MSTLPQLFAAMSVQGSDLIPVFVSGSQTTRRITVGQLLDFISSQQPANAATLSTQYAAPGVNGFTVQIDQPIVGGPDVRLILTPLTDYSSGTIVLPPAVSAFDGQQVVISTTKAITALSIGLSGALAIFGPPTTLEANDTVTLGFDKPSSSWFMIGRSVPAPATVGTVQTLTNKTLTAPTINNATLSAAILNSPTLNSPTLASAVLGTPVSGNLANCIGLPVATGISGFAAGTANFLALPTSSNLAFMITDETGSGPAVFNNAATLVAPRLGTPFSGILTNCIGLPIDTGVSGMAAGAANFLALPTSSNLAALLTDETGSGGAVFATSPTLQAATLNSATLNAPTINAPSYGAPVNKTANFTVATTENMIICSGGATITVTLPNAATSIGRTILMKNVASFTVVSAAANVGALAGGAPTTAIMPATPGSKVTLVSDGANWVIMA